MISSPFSKGSLCRGMPSFWTHLMSLCLMTSPERIADINKSLQIFTTPSKLGAKSMQVLYLALC